jgi:ADYC domain
MFAHLKQSAPGAVTMAFALLLWSCAETGALKPDAAPSPPEPVATQQAAAPAPAPEPEQPLHAIAGHFELVQPLGANLRGEQLIGAEFTIAGAKFGIDAIERDPEDPTGEIELYRISRLDAKDHPSPYCPSTGNTPSLAFPMAGSWTATGRHLHDTKFSLICPAAAEAKCVRLGYRPWRNAASGTSLWDYHEACVRALRADYCGTGALHSAERSVFTLYDTIGIRPLAAPAGQSFEAAWGPRGAACVRHVRGPSARVSLRDLRTECSNLPKTKLAESCDEREPAQIYSKSRDDTPPPEN